MTKKILILSSTPRSNFVLSEQIAQVAKEIGLSTDIVELEALALPLYTVEAEKQGIPQSVKDLAEQLIAAPGFVFVAPEYNGGLPPVSVNVLNWISRAGGNWREAFDRKMVLLASSSGGGGANLLRVMNTQLQHLGAIVLPRPVVVNSSKTFSKDAAVQGLECLKRWGSTAN